MAELLGRTVTRVERLEPWFVARVHLDGPPHTVIRKWLRTNAEGFRTDPAQLDVERDALRRLDALDVAPRLLGVEDDGALLVEDLAPRRVLWDLLARGDDGAARGLRAFAAVTGRLHARTMDPDHAPADTTWWLPRVDALAIEPGAAVEAEMGAAHDLLVDSEWVAFSNGDPGANNCMVADDDARLIDFELARFRHALLDAQCLFVPGSMWMTVADPNPLGVVDAYCDALGRDLPADALAAACLVTAFEKVARFAKLDARPPGHHSRAQLIATLESAARTSPGLPQLRGWALRIAEALRRRWPDADVDHPDAYTLREPLLG